MIEKYTDVDKYTCDLIKKIVSKVTDHPNSCCVSAIIVTGSFGRNEATFERDKNGYLTLKSDVEVALVYNKFKERRKVAQLMKEVENCFSEMIEFMPFQKQRIIKAQNNNYALIEPKYKSLFTYDIYNGSYTAWGTDYLRLKKISLEQVDLFEAKKIVGNRIGELICFLNKGSNMYDDNYKRYWKAKLMLAIVSAYLLCTNAYISSYQGQYDRIMQQREVISSTFGKEFLLDYKKSFIYLRKNGTLYDVSDEKLRNYVAIINEIFQKKGITNSKINCFSKRIRRWAHYLKCGSNYGFNFENNLYQNMINGYIENTDYLQKLANDWKNVLYK